MTYAASLGALSRRPQLILVLTLDACANTFGSAPCTASGTPCYNTLSTCKVQDAADYVSGTKDYKFCLHAGDPPIPGEIIRPYILKYPSFVAAEIDPKRAMTTNAKVTLDMIDPPDNDIGVDPSASQRPLYPNAPGTFWKKLLARNPYYLGRPAVIKTGFVGLAEADYVPMEYILDAIDVQENGSARLVLKDPLKRADQVEIPAPTAGKVTDNPLSSAAATINVDDTSEYSSSGWVRIGDEIIQHTGKTGTSLTGCTRAAFGTTAAQHDQDAQIQQCYVKQAVNAADIMLDILSTVGIPSAKVDTTGIEAERDAWLLAFAFTGIISKPEKASNLLAELQEQSGGNLWWDEEAQQVKMKVLAPPSPSGLPTVIWNDEAHLVKVSVDRNEASRVSRVFVYYNHRVPADEKKPEGFKNAYIAVDAAAEGSDQYNAPATKTIFSRWIATDAVASTIATRLLNRYRDPASRYAVTVELKDSGVRPADLVGLSTSQVLGVDGTPVTRNTQVLKSQPRDGGQVDYTLQDAGFGYGSRFGFIAPASQPDWDSASAGQKVYAYIGDTNNELGTANDAGFVVY